MGGDRSRAGALFRGLDCLVLAGAASLATFGCLSGMEESTLPDGREVVSTRASNRNQRYAVRYQAAQDLHCPEDEIRVLRYGNDPYQASGCGRGSHYTCERHVDGPEQEKVRYVCKRVD